MLYCQFSLVDRSPVFCLQQVFWVCAATVCISVTEKIRRPLLKSHQRDSRYLIFVELKRRKYVGTRMHSNRMRTVRCSGRGGFLLQCTLGYTPPPR